MLHIVCKKWLAVSQTLSRFFKVCIGNYMISSALLLVFEKFPSAYLFQIAQEKSCDYLLIIYTKKNNYNKRF